MNNSDNFDRAAPATTQERNRASLYQWCDLAAGMQAIRGQWKTPVLIALSESARDIPALQARLTVIDRRVIVRTLRELEAEHLVIRTDPTRYSLTADGERITQILRDIAQWQAARKS